MQISGAIPERVVVAYEDALGNPVDVSSANALPVTGGGGGGGGTLSDTVFEDSLGQLFVYRDTGTGTPNAYQIPDWTLYTPVGAVSSASETSRQAALMLLTRVLNYLNAPQGYDKSLTRYRVTAAIESGTVTTVSTVTTVTTVTTVSTVASVTSAQNLVSIGGIQGQIGVYGQNLSAWADCVRARIT
jgi:CBS domain-containing protein